MQQKPYSNRNAPSSDSGIVNNIEVDADNENNFNVEGDSIVGHDDVRPYAAFVPHIGRKRAKSDFRIDKMN